MMRTRTMKPETIARRAKERVAKIETTRRACRERMRALVERDGPDSIWAEMLAEALERDRSAA